MAEPPVAFDDIKSAAEKIKGKVKLTPCERSHSSDEAGIEIYLKKEFQQFTGSFKERGALNALCLLGEEERRKGVIAVSMGNHAQAISYHGNKLGIPVTVVMPVTAPLVKVQKCRTHKANVVVEGQDFAEATEIADKMTKELGLTYISPYNHRGVIAGQGTIGLEIVEQVADIAAVVVPTGGGGLIAGIALAVKSLNPSIKIVAVEAERCASYANALSSGAPKSTKIDPTLADGLAVSLIGPIGFETSKTLVDKMVLVKEETIALAILKYLENDKCVVEGAGACSLAAVLSGQLNEFKGKKVVLIVSGGNIDMTVLERCVNRGLASEGRLVKCRVTIRDRPGGLSELCQLFDSAGVSIKDIVQERAWVTSDVFSVEALIVCETRNYEHSAELYNLLRSKQKKFKFESFPCKPA